ncbi:tail fiber domain-containing protein [uncultured Aquimarina sp.]|uniref:tail fiber domain-containing protein n=1 Tax=uncultured Aquimarina sp. TaxID=575652 RepID=UPI0026247B4E|nr:tail fiber domain-containing protein [uncultured Aquimarina sp.]
MNKNTPFVILLLCSMLGFSQSFNYQAVVRNAGGDPVVNQSIGVQVQVLEGAGPDTVVYTETHTVTSSAQGVISIPIGTGTTSDTFSSINWSQQNQWIGIAVDITGGTTYISIGTTKLQQVPYALHASMATTATTANAISGNLTTLADADGNTQIQVEETANENIIRFDTDGTEIAQMSKNANGDLLFNTITSNVIMGQGAGGVNTGDSNVFVGRAAARLNTTGRRNVIMGSQAGFLLVDGTNNVYVGTIAGRDNVSGSRNTFLGDGAGATTTAGNSNTMIGTATGGTSAGGSNVVIGDSAAGANAIGNNNTIMGTAAGLNATGNGNIFLGYFTGANETGDNKLYIDNSATATPLIYGTFDTNTLIFNGTTTTTGATYANGGIYFPGSFAPDDTYVGAAGNFISFGHPGASEDFLGYTNNNFYFRDSPGGGDAAQPSVYAQSFPTYSSRRWKHSINDIQNAFDTVEKLRGVTYTWNKDHGGHQDFGFIAEEVHEILPQAAKKGTDGEIDGVDYGRITPYLVEAIKEQQEQIEQLKAIVQKQQAQLNKISKIEAVLSALGQQLPEQENSIHATKK